MTEWYSLDDSWNVASVGQEKCGGCGSRKHHTSACQTDLKKVKCFRCHEFGHTAHCPKSQSKKVPKEKPRLALDQRAMRFKRARRATKEKERKANLAKGLVRKVS